MARPNKQGLDYFPLDVDFFDNDKISLIEAEFGSKGVLVVLRLLCKIYKNGYYYQWGDDECLLLSKQLGAGFVPNFVREVVTRLVNRSFFDKGVYDSFCVLTSANIQQIYLQATKERKGVAIRENLRLLSKSEDKPSKSADKLDKSPEKVHKVNKSKINKNSLSLSPSHEVESGGEQATGEPSQREKDLFFEILFFRNIKEPEKEVLRFIDHYTANGWRRAGGAKIADRAAVCRQWKQKDESAKRFPQAFIEALHEFYAEHRDVRLLHSVERIETKDGILIMYFADKFGADFIEAHKFTFSIVVKAMNCTHLARHVKRQKQHL